MFKNLWRDLRKFGLDYDDFPTMLENVSFLLKILTINIYNNVKNPIPVIFYIITSLAGFTYVYVYIFSLVWMVVYRYGRDDIESSIIVFAMSSCNCTCLTKLFFMKIYAKEIKNTVDRFLHCDAQVMPSTRFAENLRKNLRIIKKRASIIWIFLVLDGVIYLAIPFLIPGRQFTTDLFLIYGLEPMIETPNYEIAMTIFMVSIAFAIYAMLGVAVYMIVVVGYTEAQLHALSEELRNLWTDSQKVYNHSKNIVKNKTNATDIKEELMNEFTSTRLRDIIKLHTANISLLNELEHEFRPTLALEYSIMSCSIVAGLIAGLDYAYLQLPYTFVQIFIYCFVGQRLIDACDDFENALYSCKWENFNTSNQKTIFIMLIMSQKTLMLSAGGVAKLNFNSLMVIIKSTFSAYTTLQSVIKK